MKGKRDADFNAFMAEYAPYEAGSTAAPVFDTPAFQTLMECWRESAGEDILPDGSRLPLSKLAPWMPDMSKLTVEGPFNIRYRLVGTRACERLGMDPTGQNLYDMMDPSIRDTIARSFAEMVTRPCGFYGRYENVNTAGRRSAIQSLYLPLKPLPDGTPKIIGMHAPGEMIDYGSPAESASIATAITDFTWIDLGFGAPC
ncbi:hypothetical protein FHS78_000780 [Parvibaculum indicum]|uniref:PAS domain-containing protein n=1 Tax=Parvibaculum indicum TaxID=562969 RepID=UPI0014218D3D|nr:PAS domain-containing protein [Parvibaculum indicum]NIJ40510.1 hypothetical protein [Parvibaculum indicum]